MGIRSALSGLFKAIKETRRDGGDLDPTDPVDRMVIQSIGVHIPGEGRSPTLAEIAALKESLIGTQTPDARFYAGTAPGSFAPIYVWRGERDFVVSDVGEAGFAFWNLRRAADHPGADPYLKAFVDSWAMAGGPDFGTRGQDPEVKNCNRPAKPDLAR